MTTLPNIALILPVRGAPGSGLWADTIDADLALLDAHDHGPGKGLRINSDAIAIDADVGFGALYAPKDLHRAQFSPITALTLGSTNLSIFVNGADNELYWRSNAGTNVKLTSGGALNVAAFTGGIGGDYVSVGAAVAFDDAGDRYTFKQQSNLWARMASGEVRILETGTTESVYVGLAAPAALAGSYSITLPLALPGSTSLVQMDSSGVLTASNTIGNTLTLPASVAGTPNFTGAVTMGSTLGVTGLITATAGVTAAVNQHVTVSGTGEYKHGDRILDIAPQLASGSLAAAALFGMAIHNATAYLSIPLHTGDRIKSVTFARFGDGAVDCVVTVYRVSSTNVQTSLGAQTVTNAPAAWADTVIDVTDTTLTATDSIVIEIAPNADGWVLGAVRVTYDHP